MILDKTIDIGTARYWCIFCDKKLQKHLDKIKSESTINEFDIGSMLMYASYLFTGMSLVSYIAPYIKNLFRTFSSKDDMVIAYTTFEADGSNYKAYFDLDNMKWALHSDYSISEHETVQFFETQYFNNFNMQCQAYINPIFNSEKSILKNIKKVKDKKVVKFITELLKNKNRIRDNMFNPHYIT